MKRSELLFTAREIVQKEMFRMHRKAEKSGSAEDAAKASEYCMVNKFLYDEYHKAHREEEAAMKNIDDDIEREQKTIFDNAYDRAVAADFSDDSAFRIAGSVAYDELPYDEAVDLECDRIEELTQFNEAFYQ